MKYFFCENDIRQLFKLITASLVLNFVYYKNPLVFSG